MKREDGGTTRACTCWDGGGALLSTCTVEGLAIVNGQEDGAMGPGEKT